MKRTSLASALGIAALMMGWMGISRAQGPLTPPAPPGPTMKTLAQVEPRTDVLTLLPDGTAAYAITAPGSYYLSSNIVVTAGVHGINIKTNNVRLDLNGFTMFGPSDRMAIMTSVSGLRNVDIANGYLAGWASGVNFYTAGGISNVSVTRLQIDLSGASYGQGVIARGPLRVSHCNIRGANTTGAAGIFGGDEEYTIEHCQLKSTGGGILVGNKAVVRFNKISSCAVNFAISVGDESLVEGNIVTASDSVRAGSSCAVLRNIVRSGTASGIRITGSNNRLEDNQSIGNFAYGIMTDSGTSNNLVIRNWAAGNSYGNYNFLGATISGPLVSSSGVIATNNPWANFSF